MSMSTHVIGIRPATAEYKKKVAAYEACQAAGVAIPRELEEYFNGESPNPDGMEVEIEDTDAVDEYNDDSQQGFDVNIKELPKGVTIIRFYNAY